VKFRFLLPCFSDLIFEQMDRPAPALITLVVLLANFQPWHETYGLQLEQCGAYGNKGNPAPPVTNNGHKSRMCRRFLQDVERAPLRYFPNGYIDPCIMVEVYPAGLYSEQLGITVKFNTEEALQSICSEYGPAGDYEVKSIAMQAVNRNGYPFGTFVMTPDPRTPLKHQEPKYRHFYYDGKFDPATSSWDVGDKDKDCQDYKNPPTDPKDWKRCTCQDQGTSDPRRNVGFNKDEFYPPMELIKCPAIKDPLFDAVSISYTSFLTFNASKTHSFFSLGILPRTTYDSTLLDPTRLPSYSIRRGYEWSS